ncbi:glycosyl transferase [Scytonema sp. UIC 10036]|uniref:ArnT family glycosyltransferase n=1 Tax=Scytonema sp. UIC 10036 TaxID=2304196 RepID=UPI0012DA3CC6|nr:glycosyltransferase family 39 protein [Scytonema sp. UIC 10036]MUG94382.1 glycosyl transferase [Scytonema sp. UIC 10036]
MKQLVQKERGKSLIYRIFKRFQLDSYFCETAVERWLALGLLLTLGLLLGMLGFSIWEKIPSPVERVIWSQQAQWIAPQTPTYRFYARHTFYLSDSAKVAWVAVSADNDFTLYVNGQQVTRENSRFNNSVGLSTELKMPFQAINDSDRYRVSTGLNYLLASSNDWKLTAYVDITSYLRLGKNVIGLEIQKGQTNPRVVVEGVVYPIADNKPIILTTGVASWQVANLSETHRSLQWFDVDFPDTNWLEAKVLGSVKEATYTRLSKNLFARPLQGNWVTGNHSSYGEVWLTGVWQMPKTQISHAYIRFAGTGEYSLLLNSALVSHYKIEDGKQLHLVEVTKLLQPGSNILAVRLAHSLEPRLTNGSVNFFLDGWAEREKGEIIGAIATDETWKTLAEPVVGWVKGEGSGKPATLLGLPQRHKFQHSFEGNAYLLNYPQYLWRQSIWQFLAVGLTLIYALILGFWLGYRDSWWHSLNAGAAILSPGTLFLIGIGLLKHRYAEAEIGLLFAQPKSNYVILLGFANIVLLSLILSQMKSRLGTLPRGSLWFFFGVVTFIGVGLVTGENLVLILLFVGGIITLTSNSSFPLVPSLRLGTRGRGQNWLTQIWRSHDRWLLVLIVTIGFGLRVYHLGFMDLDSDENTSLDATRGILRTGAPIATSGIWYTRGPFYHYLLALWLRIIGDSIVHARFFSVLWGTATLVLIYIFARKVTGKVWIALFITAVLALSPWEIWYSRNIRFYQLLQFLTILSFWLFFKGFIEQASKRYQYLFFIALTCTLLTQEISLTILPTFLLGFLYFYRPFRLLRDWQIVLGSIMTLIIFIYCLGFSSIRLLTPLAALSDSTASYLRLHFSNITELSANFFIGPDRMQTVYTLFFMMGFVYFFKQNNLQIIFFFSGIISQIIIVTILSYQSEERYAYGIYPLFILLTIYSTISITESLGNKFQLVLNGAIPLRTITLSFAILLLLINTQPTRMLAGYQEAINRRNTSIFEYIRIHKQPEDVVISPTPSFGSISLNGLDYFLLGSNFFDGLYWNEGRLIDRWAGGVVVSNIDQMNRILEKSKRVWLHIDDIRESRINTETWQYIQTLGKPVIDTFGTRLRLWQPEDGLPSRIPNTGKDLGAY